MKRAALALLAALLVLAGLTAPAGAQDRARPPALQAREAILVEPATGDVVYSRDPDRRRAIASTTKLMTALLTLEKLSLDDVVAAIPYAAAPAESIAGTRAGERLTVRDALRALMLQSANDVAATLAVRIAGSQRAFVRMMNDRAKQLGLTGTRYANPIGLDAEGAGSTATDLVKLTLVLRRNSFFRQTVDLPKATVRLGDRTRTFVNRNTLVRTVPEVDGVKTGHTNAAGYVLVGSATKGGVTVVAAVLGDPSEAARNQDALALLRYGLSRYRVRTAVAKGDRLASAALKYRDESVALVAARTVRRTGRVGEGLRTRVAGAPEELEGPLGQGAQVGTVEVVQRGRVVARVPLVTAAPVSAASASERLSDFAGRSSTLLLLGAFVSGSLLLVLLRRRVVRRREPVGEGIA